MVIALVVVTAFYARETWRLVRAPYRPFLMPRFAYNQEQNDGYILQLKIKNIGVGIAIDIEIKYSIEVDSTADEPQTGKMEILYPPDKSDPVKRSELSLDINGLQPMTPIT